MSNLNRTDVKLILELDVTSAYLPHEWTVKNADGQVCDCKLKVAGIDGICIPLMPYQIVESPGKNQAVELLVKAGLAVRLADIPTLRRRTLWASVISERRAFRLKTPEW